MPSHPLATPACLLLSSALLAASPTPRLERATFIHGNAESWLVTEFVDVGGCPELVVKQVKRDSTAVTLEWGYVPTPASSQKSSCAKIKRIRRIDTIPVVSRKTWEQTTCGATGYPCSKWFYHKVFPTTLTECHDSSCSSIPVQVIDNDRKVYVPNPGDVTHPYVPDSTELKIPSLDSARSWLRHKFLDAKIAQIVTVVYSGPPIVSGSIANATPSYKPAKDSFFSEFTVKFDLTPKPFSPPYSIASLWGSIHPILASPSPGNVADLFVADSVEVTATNVGPANAPLPPPRIATGVQWYHYRSRQTSSDGVASPTIVGDTLLLDGASLILSNHYAVDSCRDGQLEFLPHSWLYLTSDTTTPFEGQFRQQRCLPNGHRWYFAEEEWDAPAFLYVNGFHVPLESILTDAPISVDRRHRSSRSFVAKIDGSGILLDLPESSPVDLIAPSGRILSSGSYGAGVSHLPIPGHGILLVRTRFGSKRILAP